MCDDFSCVVEVHISKEFDMSNVTKNSSEISENKLPLTDNLVAVAAGIENDPKSWWKSRTIWVNIGAIVTIIAAKYGLNVEFSEDVLAAIPVLLGILNLVLRSITTKPLSK